MRTIKVHELKIDTNYLIDITSGRKTFEIRKNDRDFKEGDFLLLFEYSRKKKEYGTFWALVKVLYVFDHKEFVLPGYCVLSIELIDKFNDLPF